MGHGAFRHLAVTGALALAATACDEESGAGPDWLAPPHSSSPRVIEYPGHAATLQAAVDLARPGDLVVVRRGRHSLDRTLVIGPGRSGLTLIADPDSPARDESPRPVLTFDLAPAAPAVEVLSDGVTLQGLSIDGRYGAAVSTERDRLRVFDCVIDGSHTFGVLVQRGEDAWVRGSHITGGAVSVLARAGAGLRLERSVLRTPSAFGVQAVDTTVDLRENTVFGAGDSGIILVGASAGEVRRNIVVGSTLAGIVGCSDRVAVVNNVLFENGVDHAAGCPGPDRDLREDPQLCDPAAGDLTVRETSPCLAGNNACGPIGALGVGCFEIQVRSERVPELPAG